MNRQIKQIEERQHRLFDAIETGMIDLDETVQTRSQSLKSAKDALLIEIAGVRQSYSRPVDQIKASQIDAFTKHLKTKLLAQDSAIAKTYLSLLVDKVVIHENKATITGSYNALANVAAMKDEKNGHLKQVPTLISDWGG